MITFRSILIRNQSNLILNPIKETNSRQYAMKSDLKIKWVRPEKISCIRPEKSGDLEAMPNINKGQLTLDFHKSKELETADENVKKLFTLKFASRKYSSLAYMHDMKEKVKRHDFDVGSIEVKLARATGLIRELQEHTEKFPRNKKLKVFLKELIDKRKKHLKYLRRWDYKKFEWVLENLNIVYKPHPPKYHWITRKESLQKLTTNYCDAIKQKRLDAYRLELESEQPKFLEEKIRTLEFIRDEQKECNLTVTVTQEEIDEIKSQLEELNKKDR